MVAYGDAAGETLGPNGVISKRRNRHCGRSTSDAEHFPGQTFWTDCVPASTSSSVDFPRKYNGTTDADSCHVLIVRRDKEGRMFYHSGFEDGGVIGTIQPVKDETSGRLKIERLEPQRTCANASISLWHR